MFNELFWMAAAGAVGDAASGETVTLGTILGVVFGGSAVVFLFFLLPIWLLIRCIVREIKNKKKLGAYQVFDHLEGLPIPQHAFCAVGCNKENLTFYTEETDYHIATERVNRIYVTTLRQPQVVTSGATTRDWGEDSAGIFGGGRYHTQTKNSTVMVDTPCLVVVYETQGGQHRVILDATNNKANAKNFAYKAKKYYTQKHTEQYL